MFDRDTVSSHTFRFGPSVGKETLADNGKSNGGIIDKNTVYV